MITLVTGGIKSGKTAYALKLCLEYGKKGYIATAEPFDSAMNKKISLHRQERDETWVTHEEPVNLHEALKQAQSCDIILIDCITMWLNNLMYKELNIDEHIGLLLRELETSEKPVVMVTNEVGLGVMPANPEGCRYADELGRLNQKLANISDRVILMVSSLPLIIKGAINES